MKLTLVFLFLVGCSSSTPAPESETKSMHEASIKKAHDATPMNAPPAIALLETNNARPACLNIQDGDWHIEFNGKSLLLSEVGAPKPLLLDDGSLVDCAKLEIVKNARHGTVMIQYTTDAKGTSIGVSDTMLGLASIKESKWIVEPVVLERHIDADDKTETRELNVATWSLDKNDGHAILTLTDRETRRSKIVRP